MGCCGSSEATAEECELPPPEWGKPISVTLKKKWMDADYNVLVANPEGGDEPVKWMLLDAVGSMWDDGYVYYLKHRAPGQVDEEGKACSTTLGSVNIKGEWDCFSFKISGGSRDADFGPVFDLWDHDIDWGFSEEKSIWAMWTYSKRAILYADYEQTKQVGWLDITGSGTFHEWEEERVVYDTDDDGHTTTRYERDHHQDCKTHAFQYQLNVFNTPMIIKYDKVHGGFWKSSKLNFTASNAFAPDVPLFTVSSDGEYNAEVHSFENSDPVSTLLAAYAISCKLDPKEFNQGAERECGRHIRFGMPAGHSECTGMPFEQFAQTFSYPAPPMPVFAAQVAAFVPPPMQTLVFGAPGGMPAPPMMAQPMMQQQPMMMAQPMAMPAQPQPMVMTATATVPEGQPMQIQTQTGVITVMVPPGIQPGMQFQFQAAAPQPQMAMAQPAMAMAQPAYGSNYQ